MSAVFDITEHVIDASHIRQFARATSHSQEDVLKLAIRQYTPKDNPNPQPGDVTVIGGHANGFPKELYEAVWEDLHAESKKHGFRIRSIWIADAAWQGQSFVLNESKLGNDPSWLDHPRDLLHMINHFRMPRPLVGIGHSFGGNSVTNVALMHPRLFQTLILLDPVISRWSSTAGASPRASPAGASAGRRDIWPSKAAAREAFVKNKFYQAWDRRVLDSFLEYGLRETPTQLYPSEKGSATLTTTKHQEVFTYLRPSWEAYDEQGETVLHRDLVPDMDLSLNEDFPTFPFYRSEGASTTAKLPTLRPSVLYVFGESSAVSVPEIRKEKMELTGTGVGGSGGAPLGRVKEVLLKDRGHLFPMESPKTCAELSAAWIEGELATWKREQAEYEAWTAKSDEEKTTISDEWKRRLGRPDKPTATKAKF